jgi:ring-1,2-phenylacetyl-CoA epoxidase subunit PaaE
VAIGDCLNAIAPAGRFRLHPARQYFFIAAGIGITPIISLIKKALAEQPMAHLVLITQNHNETTTVFYHALQSLVAKQNSRLQWISLLSHPKDPAHGIGRLNNTLLENLLVNTLEDREPLFYICGPEALMRMVMITLASMGFAADTIKKENFKVDYTPPPPLLHDYSPKQVSLRLQDSLHFFSVSYPKTILQAALDEGIILPFSCRAGRCSTCVARCLTGEVIMSNNEVLTDKDTADGLVLTCVGYAKSDLILEV